ncbi:MAG: type II secretion system GspH family protein [Oscillospiraceae bacterium]|nr:type II secretion system GspH family protein [Oscillospiraceae bacterium]
MNTRKNKEKGMTLIALIVTVIVMLILAGVAIRGVINTGLIDKTKQATELYNNSVNDEENNINNIKNWFGDKSEEETTVPSPDGNGNWNGIVSPPKLASGMKAVYWAKDDSGDIDTLNPANNTTEIVQGDNPNFKIENWYNYVAGDNITDSKTSRWANAKTEDGSYWVWIPRYEYKIDYTGVKQGVNTDVTKAGKIEINFIPTSAKSGASGYTTATSKGQVVNGVTVDAGITVSSDGYIIHPAFTDGTNNGYANGEWDSELSGFWVAKFEMSMEKDGKYEPSDVGNYAISSNIKAVSKPGVSSWTDINIANSYENSFNYDRAKESHLIKNSEWGAVAYLTHSQYGRNGTEVSTNNCGFTGGMVNTFHDSSYATLNTAQSSTGNPTGIYDLSGCSNEYVAAFNKKYSGEYYTAQDYLSVGGTTFASTNRNSTKYATAYSNSTNTWYAETFADFTSEGKDVSHIGDAIHEVWIGAQYGWFSDSCVFYGGFSVEDFTFDFPFSSRGGNGSGGNNAGVFNIEIEEGAPSFSGDNTLYGFRVVLVP